MSEFSENNVVMLNDEPEIKYVDNFLTPEECKHFIDVGSINMTDSLVTDIKNGYKSEGRTSKNSWINHNHDDIVYNVAKRIANFVNIPLENAEAFQCVYYGETNEYKPHYDTIKHDGSDKTLRVMKYGGARLITTILYLNEVEEGGSTRFTKIDKEVQPSTGKLLFFENVYKGTHDRHILSEHAGMPVIKGEKYIVNLWFRECSRNMLYKDFNPSYYESSVTNVSLSPPAHQYFLEKGDFFPFICINFFDCHKKHIHNYVEYKEYIIIHVKNIEALGDFIADPKYITIIIFSQGIPPVHMRNIATNNPKIYQLFRENDEINIYHMTPNRKIFEYNKVSNISEYNMSIEKPLYQPNIPYLYVHDVLSQELLEKIRGYFNDNENQSILHSHSGKNRNHLYPNKELEMEIDNKLSRSLFPEIKKVFYFDVNYRELYKICSYKSETKGRFHPHRDTPEPYQHRRYAMSLFLNDDYEGGEFELIEYGLKIKPQANSAIVFPGISTHKVNEVTKGSRQVIISFFCSELEGKTKNNPSYTLKSNFFKDRQITYSNIYPI
jgi:prolyl 4-hydroxylase